MYLSAWESNIVCVTVNIHCVYVRLGVYMVDCVYTYMRQEIYIDSVPVVSERKIGS